MQYNKKIYFGRSVGMADEWIALDPPKHVIGEWYSSFVIGFILMNIKRRIHSQHQEKTNFRWKLAIMLLLLRRASYGTEDELLIMKKVR